MAEGYSSVEAWLSRLGSATARNNRFYFRNFTDWLRGDGGSFSGFTPDQLIKFQREASNDERYELLDVVQRYVLSLKGLRQSSRRHRYMVVRSFFLHNRAELPGDRSFKVRGEVPKVRGQLTADDIKNMVLSCKPCYQAVYLCLFMGGMGLEELHYWSRTDWPALKEALRHDPEIIRVDLPGRKMAKNERPYYTFIGGDALDALRRWVKERPPEAEGIFTDQFGRTLSKKAIGLYWLRHLRMLGLATRDKSQGVRTRTGRNPHELRDSFRTAWAKSPASPDVAEFMLGHQIDELGYNKCFTDEGFMRREYLKAIPYLNVMTGDLPHGKIGVDQVEQLQRKIRELEAERGGEVENLSQRIDELTRIAMEQKQTIELMTPTFSLFQKMLDDKREWDKLRGSPPEL